MVRDCEFQECHRRVVTQVEGHLALWKHGMKVMEQLHSEKPETAAKEHASGRIGMLHMEEQIVDDPVPHRIVEQIVDIPASQNQERIPQELVLFRSKSRSCLPLAFGLSCFAEPVPCAGSRVLLVGFFIMDL